MIHIIFHKIYKLDNEFDFFPHIKSPANYRFNQWIYGIPTTKVQKTLRKYNVNLYPDSYYSIITLYKEKLTVFWINASLSSYHLSEFDSNYPKLVNIILFLPSINMLHVLITNTFVL